MKTTLKTVCLIMMCLMALPFLGCGEGMAEPAPGPEPTPTFAPIVSESPLPSETPSVSPGESPLAEDEFTAEELMGIAEASDVLPSYESYEEAVEKNPDVVGWITIPGTSIDYPVVRCDNNEYYLGRNVEKEKSRYGSIFMDFRNADADQQRHIIIYGHNMKNGTMFHDLMNYKQQSFFNENRYVYFLWDGTETIWEIYLATIVKSYDNYSINYIETRFGAGDNFSNYMTDMQAYARSVSPSIVDKATAITNADQVLTLSTCTYEYDNSRFAVQARRVK